MGSLVTVGTDGFRDFVDLPDGRSFNLGSVSVLKLVTSLVSSPVLARKALDTFLTKGMATISVDLAALENLVRPPRSRWAGHENRLISPVLRPTPFRGASTMSQTFLKQVSAIEAHLSVMASEGSNPAHVSKLKDLAASLATFEQDGFERRLTEVEGLMSTFQPGSVGPEQVNSLQKLAKELLAGGDSKESEEKESRFEEGKPADPTENMSKEDAAEWKKQNEKNKDKFKSAAEEPAEKKSSEASPEETFKTASVNEALATTLMGKVEAALGVVTASDRANTEVAKHDLHLISEKLASMLQETDLTDSGLQDRLLDLSSKVAKIHGHFAPKAG